MEENQTNELISLCLWSIRRLPTETLKHYALSDLRELVDKDHKFSDFIDRWLVDIKKF
jgi:hypothetical protein